MKPGSHFISSRVEEKPGGFKRYGSQLDSALVQPNRCPPDVSTTLAAVLVERNGRTPSPA
jgi:hypothetical protein